MATAYSATSDFVLALLPWTLLIGLQMKRAEKIGVGVAMSMGFLYVYLPNLLNSSCIYSPAENYRAGICAMVKTIKLPTLSDPDGCKTPFPPIYHESVTDCSPQMPE